VKKIGFFLLLCVAQSASAQYWQQKVDYVIDVTLNDSAKTLDGFESLTYTNNSPDTLRFIWFHLWPNAYKNDRTHFSEQQLLNGNTDFYFSGKEERGYINRLDFKADGLGAKTEDHPSYIDVIKLVLPKPLPPGGTTKITTPFHVKLPFNFSRGGYAGKSFQVTQWYPKPAVYDAKGWHPMPYLDQGEFYSEFGNYDVRIHADRDFIIAATGELQNGIDSGYVAEDFRSGIRDSISGKLLNSEITWNFKQENVHDFAWFAHKNYIGRADTCMLTSGRVIKVFTYYTNDQKKYWERSLEYAKAAVRFYSDSVGEYPYGSLRVVLGPESFGGGMEYPTITVISPIASAKDLDIVIAHEIGHNWFYGMLASNERDHPWMDEGINSFFERKYTRMRYGERTDFEEKLFHTIVKKKTDQPIETTSENFSSDNYGLIAYYKTAKWMEWIEKKMGSQKFHDFIHEYFNQWKFKHPQPANLKLLVEKYLPGESDAVFAQLNTTGIVPDTELTGTFVHLPLPYCFLSGIPTYKNYYWLLPAVGINKYDGLMAGAFFTNYNSPPAALQFFAAPLYGLKSKSWNGIGRIDYSSYPRKGPTKIQPFLSYSAFSNDLFTDQKDKKHFTRFNKLAPGIIVEFAERNPLTRKLRYFEWKSFFINEDMFRISFDTIRTPVDTTVNQVVDLRGLNYAVHRLKFGYENNRTLYPHNIAIMFEGAKQFARLTLEGNYFFNYKDGGLSARLFAGKFFYDDNQKYPAGFYPDRFMLDMSATNGYGDYTYSNYFYGRNEFEGFASRQIAIRDGGFKIRTDLLGNRVGVSDDWLAALNLNTSIPKKLNPLSILPVKIPLHLFFDIGTYSGAKEENTSGRFLFDAGVHVPLLSGVINFYFPVFYSSEYREYVNTVYTKNRFIRASTFSIDLQRFYRLARKSNLL
jgi:Peptidase family M1 domain